MATGKKNRNKENREWGKSEGRIFPKTADQKQQEIRDSWLNSKKR